MKMLEFSSKHFTLEKVKDGIYAAIAKEGGGSVGNAGFIDLGNQTVIFDTFNTQQAAEELYQFTKNITGKTVTWVINSHWHGDHIRGNQIFKDSHIISSLTTYNKMKELHPERIAKQKNDIGGLQRYINSLKKQYNVRKDKQLEYQINFLKEIESSLPTLELVLPNQTFQGDMMFHGTKRSAKLFTLGGGHSFCDAMLYLPEDHVIFMGDLLFVDTHPSLFEDSNPNHWIHILKETIDLEIEFAIPGHGPVGTKSSITKLLEYFSDISDVANEIRDSDAISMIVKYQNWSGENVYKQNIKILKDFFRKRDLSKK
ncbi:MAG: MBL fold metallo-hydrolase [Heyndrickxia sp.]